MNQFARVWVLLMVIALIAAPAWGAIFSDIQGLPAQRAIERIAAKGVIRVSGERFNPSGTVTRSDFAVYLSRALGISGQGLQPPEVKDWGDVPREAQSAVTAMASMGSATPQKVEVRKGPLVFTLQTDKPTYGPSDMVELTFTIANTGTSDTKFEFANSQFYDFIIKDTQGVEIARWSLGRAFLPLTEPLTLAAGAKFEYKTRWRQLDQNDDPVPPGRYEITAIQTTKGSPTTLALAFHRGVLVVFPDNTFRPKAEVTRAELAAAIVKAAGMSETAGTPNVTDAAEIPAALRGAVATAIEKRIVLVGADRAFRPTRPATRADAALALDAMMEALKRYDFSKGTLKDLRVGSPTIIQIEDEQKALRTYRVARAHAVYRNNVAVELRDIKVGDQVQFLKAGDVGDVAYIEATTR